MCNYFVSTYFYFNIFRGPDVPAPSISKSPLSEPAPSVERIQIVAQVHAPKGN